MQSQFVVLRPSAWKLAALQISRDLKLKALKEKKVINFMVMNIIITSKKIMHFCLLRKLGVCFQLKFYEYHYH